MKSTRRKFIAKSLLTVTGFSIAGTVFWLHTGKGSESLNIQKTIKVLNSMDLSSIKSTGEWSLARIFSHLAQSIEFSMVGYPQHKSDFFKKSIGSLAFKAFSKRGEMHHSLNEEIPGATTLDEDDVNKALKRLIKSLAEFDRYQSELKPHFAYGHLNKEQYVLAHLMHINNHFKEISFT